MFKKPQLKVLYLAIFILIFAISNAQADTFQAGIYLESVQNFDGSWGADSSTVYFETTEAVRTLRVLGGTGFAYQRGVNFIANYEIGGVEDHARRIGVIEPAGKDTADDEDMLLSTQNSDGGWGFDQYYESNVYHTALALAALDTAGITDSGVISPAVSFITSQQKADGSFGLSADHDSIYLTALVALTLSHYSGTSYAVNSAVNWLLTKQNSDGGFGEGDSTIFETAYVNMVLFAVDPTLQAGQDAVDYLIDSQEPNGSFGDDAYQTAVGALGLNAGIIETRLYAGLNLFGYQVEVPAGYTSYDMIADLGTEDEVEIIQKYNRATETFESTFYESGTAAGDMFDVVSGEGYYVNMKQEKTTSQRRPVVSVGIQFQPGLNVVAIPSTSPYTSYEMLACLGSPDEITSIQRFDKETGAFQTTSYFETQPSGVNFDIVNGEAYLVFMKVAKEVSFPIEPVEVDYEISKGGSVSDSRNFQGDSALLDQVAYYTEAQIGVPDFITYTTTGVARVSATDIQVSFSIQVSGTAPEGICEFQVEYGLLDSGMNPLEPLTNNIFSFTIKVVP